MIILFYVIAILCIVFSGFHIMDFLSWYFVKGKTAGLWLWKWLKGFTK